MCTYGIYEYHRDRHENGRAPTPRHKPDQTFAGLITVKTVPCVLQYAPVHIDAPKYRRLYYFTSAHFPSRQVYVRRADGRTDRK